MKRLFCSLSIGCGLLAAAGHARADEIWVAPTYQQDIGGLGVASNTVWPVTAIGAVRLAWAVPDDLQAFQAAKVLLIPASPGGAANLNVIVCPAQHSNLATAGCAASVVVPFTGVANRLAEVDISAAVAAHVGTPGATYLTALVYTTPTTTTDHIVGLRFAYAPKLPAGVPTLAANTFTGTQTAPAFVGDGSGLTNLPVPAGVATLGTNTFSGTQTAPAFVGNGSGLTNIAKLTANTFTATQTIDTGNLDLDMSSATAGNLTKNGTRFLHNFGGNTFLGLNAGNFFTAGGFNVAVGESAMLSNSTGYANAAVGFGTLQSNGSGCCNAALGSNALQSNITGSANTAVGNSALFGNASGSNNTALGQQALLFSGGSNNVAVGYAAGINTDGSNNILLGANVNGVAGESNTMRLGGSHTRAFMAGVRGVTTGFANALPVVIDSAGQLGTGGGGYATLGANTFTGTQTIHSGNLDLDAGSATAGAITKNGVRFLYDFGNGNTFLGLEAGTYAIPSFPPLGGGNNTGIGYRALSNDTGLSNTAVGSRALEQNTTGTFNIGVGSQALQNNTTGQYNTALGTGALFQATGSGNTAVGSSALASNTAGWHNTAVGNGAGVLSTGANNIYLGQFAGVPGESNTMYLGWSAQQTRTFIAGIRGVTTGAADAVPVMIDSNGQVGTISSSRRFKEDIRDMADASRRLLQLRPVTFRYTQAYSDGSKPIQYGLVAEEVAETFPELAVRDAAGNVETVHYETLNVLLLNELKKQHDEVQQYKQRTEALEQRLNELLKK